MLVEVGRRISLRFEKGSYSFRDFVPSATDEQLYDLGQTLNRFQEDDIKKIYKFQVFEMI